MSTTTKLSDLFGSMVFNEDTMKERLSSASYEAWKKCVTDGPSLDISTANEIAQVSEAVGRGKGRHPLHPLVPAHDRRHGGEARQLHCPCRLRQDPHGILRKRAGPG